MIATTTRLSGSQCRTVETLYEAGKTVKQVASFTGLTFHRVRAHLRLVGLIRPGVRCPRKPDPTITEIEERAAAIRSRWSASEAERRRLGRSGSVFGRGA